VETEKEKKEKTVRKKRKITKKKNANPTLPCGRKWQMT
jgi:hypothetical protein